MRRIARQLGEDGALRFYRDCERLHIPVSVPELMNQMVSSAPSVLLEYIRYMDRNKLFGPDIFENLLALRNERLSVIQYCDAVFDAFMSTDIAGSDVHDNAIGHYVEYKEMKFQPENVLPWAINQPLYRIYPMQILGKTMYCLLSHRSPIRTTLSDSKGPACGVYLTICDESGSMILRHLLRIPLTPYDDTYVKWDNLCLDEAKVLLGEHTRGPILCHAIDLASSVSVTTNYFGGSEDKLDIAEPEEFLTSNDACTDVLRSSYCHSFYNAVFGHGMAFDSKDLMYGTADEKVLNSTGYKEFKNAIKTRNHGEAV